MSSEPIRLYMGDSYMDVHPADVDRLIKQGWCKKAPAKQQKKTEVK